MLILFCPFQAMRKGLLDVLPKNALEDLTAEDFRLLVNGCGEVNVQMLISFTSFNDESGTKTLARIHKESQSMSADVGSVLPF